VSKGRTEKLGAQGRRPKQGAEVEFWEKLKLNNLKKPNSPVCRTTTKVWAGAATRGPKQRGGKLQKWDVWDHERSREKSSKCVDRPYREPAGASKKDHAGGGTRGTNKTQ